MALSKTLLQGLGRTTIGSGNEQTLGLSGVDKSVNNARTRLSYLGIDAPKPQENFLVTVLKNLGRTGYGASNLIREFTNSDSGSTPGTFDPLEAFGRGFSLQEQSTGKDVMTDLGMSGDTGIFGGQNKWYNPSPAGLAGFALDVVNPLDALNWLTLGLGNTAKTAGLRGGEALAKVFGSKAGSITGTLGDEVIKTLGAPSAGKLMAQISKAGQDAGLKSDVLANLLSSMTEGMTETGMKATSKLPFKSARPITVGLQNPLTLGLDGMLGEGIEIPGSEKLTQLTSKGWNKFKETKVGNALGKAFSTKHVPTTVPDSVIVKDITSKQLDDIITGSGFNSPMNAEELNALKSELANVQSVGTTYDLKKPQGGQYANFDEIANRVGLDVNATKAVFDDELPFTMTIPEIYNKIANGTVDSKLALTQAAKLRKVMDLMADNIPDELRTYFKGTLINPTETTSFNGSPLGKIDQTSTSSPMLSYLFNFKGVDVSVVVNAGKQFNDNIWSKLQATLQTLQGMPSKNIQALKKEIQVSPVTLGKAAGVEVGAYAVQDVSIVLGKVKPSNLMHEYGHIWDAASGMNLDDYRAAKTADKSPMSNNSLAYDGDIAYKEDFADSVAKYLSDPNWAKQNPQVAQAIEKVLAGTEIPQEELDRLIQEQSSRATRMQNMPGAESQVDSLLAEVEQRVKENLNTPVKRTGVEAYKELRENLTQIFESTAQDVEQFVQQVETIFKDVPLEERKRIMDIAAGLRTQEVQPMMSREYAPTWYTKTEHDVLPKMGKAMPVNEFRNLLKSAGVKEDEVKWLGLEDLLNRNYDEKVYNLDELKTTPHGRIITLTDPITGEVAQGPVSSLLETIERRKADGWDMSKTYFTRMAESRDKVTKTEVEEWLQMNNLDVQEVMKGAERKTTWVDWLDENDPDFLEEVILKDYGSVWHITEVEKQLKQMGAPEEVTRQIVTDISNHRDPDDFANYLDELHEGAFGDSRNISGVKYSGYKLSGGEDYRELLFTLPGKQNTEGDMASQILDNMSRPEVKYQSGHWSEPNVVAHTRFDTRYTPDGEKVLFIEEIQSDWHQAGRSHGYKDDLTTLRGRLESMGVKFNTEDDSLTELSIVKARTGRFGDETKRLVEEYLDKYTNNAWASKAVAHAPFEKTWPEFVMKRMIRYASENGYDRIAWTTGAQQAERYSLSKTVDSLRYSRGTNTLTGMHGGNIVFREQVDPKDLGDYVGKEVAVKLMSPTPELSVKEVIRKGTENELLAELGDTFTPLDVMNNFDRWDKERKKVYQIVDAEGNVWGDYTDAARAQKAIDDMMIVDPDQRVLTGQELDIGGSGMKGFYDRMVPSMFEKYTKKFGAKVEPVSLQSGSGAKNLTSVNDEIIDDLAFEVQDAFTENFADPRDITMDQVKSHFKQFIDNINGTGTWGDIRFDNNAAKKMANAVSDSFDYEFSNFTLDKEDFAQWLHEQWPAGTVSEGTISQQSIKVTDQMKQTALYEGQPMFSKDTTPNPEEQLSESGQAAYNAFIKWRDSVAKQYRDMQIPMNELENYVPFIPVRGLKKDEQDALRALYGTGNKDSSQTLDDMLAFLSKTDPNLKTRTTQARAPSEVNKVLGKEWLTEDAAIAMALRGTRAIKAKEVAGFLKGFTEKYGLNYTDLAEQGGKIPQGYKMYIIKTEGNGRKTLEEVYDAAKLATKDKDSFFLPEDMANVYNEYSELIFGVNAKNPILKVYDTATSLYKKLAYLWNPGHIPRDFIGNVFNGYLMGIVNPLEYTRTAKLMADTSQEITVGGATMTVQELMDKAQKMGVLDVGAYAGETPRDVIDRLNLPGKNPVTNIATGYSNLMRKGTKTVDTLTRFTALLHELNRGKSLTEASAQVKKFMFDYFDLTPFERKVMKRIIPFYTWMRKNIPLQLEQLIKHPRNYARIESAMTAAQGEPVDWSERPDYVNDSGAIQMGTNGDYISPSLPYADLARVPTNLDAVLQLLSGVNPLIRTLPEIATNTQWFSGNPLEQYAGETRDIPLAGLLKLLGVGKAPQIDKRVTGTLLDQLPLLRNVDIMTNPDRPDKQVSRLSSFLGGPAIYSKESVDRGKAYEERDALTALIRKLTDQGIEVPTVKDIKKGKGRFNYLGR